MSKELDKIEQKIINPLYNDERNQIIDNLLSYTNSLEYENKEYKKIVKKQLKQNKRLHEKVVDYLKIIKYNKNKIKALDIINEKDVDIFLLKDSPNLAHYNRHFDYSDYQKLTRQLTKKEYDFLKKVLSW